MHFRYLLLTTASLGALARDLQSDPPVTAFVTTEPLEEEAGLPTFSDMEGMDDMVALADKAAFVLSSSGRIASVTEVGWASLVESVGSAWYMDPDEREEVNSILNGGGSDDAKTQKLVSADVGADEAAALVLLTSSSNMTSEDIFAVVDLLESTIGDPAEIEDTLDMVYEMANDVDTIRADKEISDGPIRDMIGDEGIIDIANIAISPALDLMNQGNLTTAQIEDLASNFDMITPGHIGAIQDLLLNFSVNNEELQSLMDVVDTDTLVQLAMDIEMISSTGISEEDVTTIIQ
jgi:hypothetical protein